jgi:F0F1-type ATP synthase assembly protein I
MNPRTIISSGIITALIGAMIGLAVSHIAQREARKPIIIISGAVVGFALGAFTESIRQEKRQREKDFEDSDSQE